MSVPTRLAVEAVRLALEAALGGTRRVVSGVFAHLSVYVGPVPETEPGKSAVRVTIDISA